MFFLPGYVLDDTIHIRRAYAERAIAGLPRERHMTGPRLVDPSGRHAFPLSHRLSYRNIRPQRGKNMNMVPGPSNAQDISGFLSCDASHVFKQALT